MGGINDYLSSIKKQYPDTEEVREQIEELRDTLHLKTEEYQAMGSTYNDAVKDRVDGGLNAASGSGIRQQTQRVHEPPELALFSLWSAAGGGGVYAGLAGVFAVIIPVGYVLHSRIYHNSRISGCCAGRMAADHTHPVQAPARRGAHRGHGVTGS